MATALVGAASCQYKHHPTYAATPPALLPFASGLTVPAAAITLCRVAARDSPFPHPPSRTRSASCRLQVCAACLSTGPYGASSCIARAMTGAPSGARAAACPRRPSAVPATDERRADTYGALRRSALPSSPANCSVLGSAVPLTRPHPGPCLPAGLLPAGRPACRARAASAHDRPSRRQLPEAILLRLPAARLFGPSPSSLPPPEPAPLLLPLLLLLLPLLPG